MPALAAPPETGLVDLYETDETAWLEIMAVLVEEGRFEELDAIHLSEFLTDMARRDRREAFSRLVVLMTHLLKWEFQQDKRSGSWESTIMQQRLEVRLLLESKTLRNHAVEILNDAYDEARSQAVKETGLEPEAFPQTCPFTIAELIAKL